MITPQVTLRIKLAPINPSDVNVIEGVYPQKPRPHEDLVSGQVCYIPGNEGLGEVVEIGSGVSKLRVGDRVVMGTPQAGTWASHMHARADALIPVGDKISDVQAATMSVSSSYLGGRYPYFLERVDKPANCTGDVARLCETIPWGLCYPKRR